MSEVIASYALTTVARVKDRLNMSESNLDTVLARIISGVTDLIEGECGGRRFLETTYTNEIVTIFNKNQKMLGLKNFPISSISSLQYRTGLKSNPNYTDFNTDDWEILGDGASGLIRVYGLFNEVNALRMTYVAGYKISWDNVGNVAIHNLPADLSDLCERLTIKLFKKREQEGKTSETFEGATVTYEDLINDADKRIIARYRRLPAFV